MINYNIPGLAWYRTTRFGVLRKHRVFSPALWSHRGQTRERHIYRVDQVTTLIRGRSIRGVEVAVT